MKRLYIFPNWFFLWSHSCKNNFLSKV